MPRFIALRNHESEDALSVTCGDSSFWTKCRRNELRAAKTASLSTVRRELKKVPKDNVIEIERRCGRGGGRLTTSWSAANEAWTYRSQVATRSNELRQ